MLFVLKGKIMEIITQVEYDEIISKLIPNEVIVIRDKLMTRIDFGVYLTHRAVFHDCVFVDCKIRLDLRKLAPIHFFNSTRVNCQVSGALDKRELSELLKSLKGNTTFENVSVDGHPITVQPTNVKDGRGWVLDDSFYYLGVLKTFGEWKNITAKEFRTLFNCFYDDAGLVDVTYFIEHYDDITKMFDDRKDQLRVMKAAKS
jgi:hypothetical protein